VSKFATGVVSDFERSIAKPYTKIYTGQASIFLMLVGNQDPASTSSPTAKVILCSALNTLALIRLGRARHDLTPGAALSRMTVVSFCLLRRMMRGEKTADLTATPTLRSFAGLLRPACRTENACCGGERMLITRHTTMLLFGADRMHEVQGLRRAEIPIRSPFSWHVFACFGLFETRGNLPDVYIRPSDNSMQR
jgi:hypothetical protein